MATTHSDDKAAASSNSRPTFSGDKFSGFLCDGIRIGQDFDLHGTHFPSKQGGQRGRRKEARLNSGNAVLPYLKEPAVAAEAGPPITGFSQPFGGAMCVAASLGPQVPGSYS